MAGQTELQVLSKGVDEWNAWVKEEKKKRRKFVPDLSGIDFTSEEHWGNTPLWINFRSHRDEATSRCNLRGIDLTGALASNSNFSNCLMEDSSLVGATIHRARMLDTILDRSNLSGADLQQCQLKHSSLEEVNLAGCVLRDSDLTEVRMVGANLKGAFLSGTMVRNTNMRDVKYSRRLLQGRCASMAGITQIGGNPRIRRDLLDQDYLDSTWSDWRHRHRWWNIYTWLEGFVLFLWSLFDYGRSWMRVLVVAFLFIFVGGALYEWADGIHVVFPITDDVLDQTGGRDPRDGFEYSVFVSALGFCTLGISDLVVPITLLGKLIVFGNVAAGFLTLGLLLSVLGNIFARRGD